MHLPPSAQWRIGRSKAHLAALMLCSALNATLLIFLWDHLARHAWYALLLSVLILCGHAALRWLHGPVGLLHWTGHQWRWLRQRQTAVSVTPCVLRWVMDFQTVALVQLLPTAGHKTSLWLWLERGAQGSAAWAALRRALVASAQMEAVHHEIAPETFRPTSADAPSFSAIKTVFQDSTVR